MADYQEVEDQEATIEHALAVVEVQTRAKALMHKAAVAEKYIETLREGLRDLPDFSSAVDALELALSRLDEVRDEQYALIASALSWRHTVDEVRRWHERAVAMGANHPGLDSRLVADLLYVRRVPNAPLRDQLLRLQSQPKDHGSNRSQDARYATEDFQGEACAALDCDKRQLSKTLGMSLRTSSTRWKSGKFVTLFIPYETASVLAPIFHMTPRDAGI